MLLKAEKIIGLIGCDIDAKVNIIVWPIVIIGQFYVGYSEDPVGNSPPTGYLTYKLGL